MSEKEKNQQSEEQFIKAFKSIGKDLSEIEKVNILLPVLIKEIEKKGLNSFIVSCQIGCFALINMSFLDNNSKQNLRGYLKQKSKVKIKIVQIN
jgi:hypothetical protein